MAQESHTPSQKHSHEETYHDYSILSVHKDIVLEKLVRAGTIFSSMKGVAWLITGGIIIATSLPNVRFLITWTLGNSV